MQFNSYIFILAFLPIFVISYFVLCRIRPIAGKIGLIFAGIVFYTYGGPVIATVLGISIVLNYLMSVLLVKLPNKKSLLVLTISANVGVLLFFKVLDYSINNLVLPLGISFFTFQQIMYVVNISNGSIKLNLADYLAYILYFPKLIMGPITDPGDLVDQINDNERKKLNWDNLANGLKIFSLGLFKKMVLADTFAIAVNWAFSNIDAATSMDWLLAIIFYTFEIYFDFSGYTDMAVGISNMINIRLPINFDSPYKATSIRDFWKRWHISLTEFFTRYIYIPLGGSKKGRIRTYVNIMIVFLISGFWHGSNGTFILWGVLHGAFLVFDRITEKYREKIFIAVRWLLTFLTVSVLWLLFRSDSIEQWVDILGKIFTFSDISISDGLINAFVLPETPFILSTLMLTGVDATVRGFSMMIFIASAYSICLIPKNNYRKLDDNNWAMLFLSVIAFVWGFLCLSSESVFVYFDF